MLYGAPATTFDVLQRLRTTWPESSVSAEVEPTLNHFFDRFTGCLSGGLSP